MRTLRRHAEALETAIRILREVNAEMNTRRRSRNRASRKSRARTKK